MKSAILNPQSGIGPSARLALLLYAFVALAMTWPLALHLTDRLPMGDNDLWQNVWNFWWWEEAITGRHQLPYTTDLLFQGGAERAPISLAFHTHSEANVLPSLPITSALGPAAALNVSIFLGFVLSGWGVFLLARELGATPAGAFAGGLIFACFPQRVEQSLEHLNLASCQAMPLFLLFLVRAIHIGGRWDVIGCGLLFALNALYAWHNGLLILPLALAVAAHGLARRPEDRAGILLRCSLAGATATAVLLPFLMPMLAEMLAGADYCHTPAVTKGIEALFLIIPPDEHAIWGGLFADLYNQLRGYRSAGFTCYAGWTTIALAVVAAPSCRRALHSGAAPAPAAPGYSYSLWLGAALFYTLLALGDRLVIAGADTSIPLPFALFRELPGAGTLRVANRFMVPAMLALSVTAAAGASAVLQSRFAPRRTRWSLLVASVVILVDFAWLPFPLRAVPVPEWTSVVREEFPGLLLNVPGGYRARGADDMYLQTLHHQPIVGGYTSCVLPEVEERVRALPFLAQIFEGRPQVEVDVRRDLPSVLNGLAVETVVVHLGRRRESLARQREERQGTPEARLFNPEKGMLSADLDAIRAVLREIWGEPRYRDEDVEIYRR